EEGACPRGWPGRGALPQLRQPWRVHRSAAVLGPGQDLSRGGRQRDRPALPASGDRSGHLRELPERGDRLRMKPPFGIGQIGKAFRNEITPGNFIFRTREFEQMEIEYFTTAEQADSDFTEWVEACWK